MIITNCIMNIYKAHNDDTNVTTRPFFFIRMYFIHSNRCAESTQADVYLHDTLRLHSLILRGDFIDRTQVEFVGKYS